MRLVSALLSVATAGVLVAFSVRWYGAESTGASALTGAAGVLVSAFLISELVTWISRRERRDQYRLVAATTRDAVVTDLGRMTSLLWPKILDERPPAALADRFGALASCLGSPIETGLVVSESGVRGLRISTDSVKVLNLGEIVKDLEDSLRELRTTTTQRVIEGGIDVELQEALLGFEAARLAFTGAASGWAIGLPAMGPEPILASLAEVISCAVVLLESAQR